MERREFMKMLGVVGAGALVAPAALQVLRDNDDIKCVPVMRPFAEMDSPPISEIDYSKFKTQADVNNYCRPYDMGIGRDEHCYCYLGNGKWVPYDASVKSIFDEVGN